MRVLFTPPGNYGIATSAPIKTIGEVIGSRKLIYLYTNDSIAAEVGVDNAKSGSRHTFEPGISSFR